MNYFDKLSSAMEAGASPGLPVIEIAGQKRVLIENHRGVIQYGPYEICVKVKYGCICIKGSNLELRKMSKPQLIICGCITGVFLMGRE